MHATFTLPSFAPAAFGSAAACYCTAGGMACDLVQLFQEVGTFHCYDVCGQLPLSKLISTLVQSILVQLF